MPSHRILRLPALVLALAVTLGCTAAGPSSPTAPGRPPGRSRPAAAPAPLEDTAWPEAAAQWPPVPAPLRLLHAWDTRRARAYAAGSVPMLRDLYVSGCAAGRVDVRLLREYAARGYRVHGLRMQVLALHVLLHAPGRWRLRVTDRVAHAVAVGHGSRLLLPRDAAGTRVLELVRGSAGRWRVAAVRPVAG